MDTLKTATPIVISAIAVVISIVTYASSTKPANITLSVGEQMQIYHGKDQALSVDLPIVIQNTGARAGIVRSLGLIFRDPGTKEAIFVKWMGCVKPEERQEGSWIWESNATPLSVPAASEITKMAESYGAGSVAGWLPKPIEYELYLVGWTSESPTPSKICMVKWMFKEKDVAAMKLNLETVKNGGAVSSTWVTRTGYAPDPKELSMSEFDDLVGNR